MGVGAQLDSVDWRDLLRPVQARRLVDVSRVNNHINAVKCGNYLRRRLIADTGVVSV
jgi:hypothetical protein